MSKRSDFRPVKHDAYYTWDKRALPPLIPHLYPWKYFWEPCAGDGTLVRDIEAQTRLKCTYASDIDPQHPSVMYGDALVPTLGIKLSLYTCIITNPPWTRRILHPMITEFTKLGPTWLLLDADWMHTKQAIPYMKKCQKIVSIGRLKWIKDSLYDGKDNCCWYLFCNDLCVFQPQFYPKHERISYDSL